MSSGPGKVVSLIRGKCPRCRKGNVFSHPFYSILNFSEVHDHCPHCGVKLEPEPGFFWGAMYFSYALNVGVSIIAGFSLFFFFNDPDLWVYIMVIILLTLILMPLMTRFSRLLLMYLVAPYRKFDPIAGEPVSESH